jgi:hypothetical protein
MKLVKFNSFFNNNAKYIYLINLLFCAFIPFYFEYFPTHDGAAHLFNALATSKIIFDKSKMYSLFFDVNMNMQPNILLHLLMVVLLKFISPIFVYKITLSSIILLLGFGFKFYLKRITSNYHVISILFLPFLFNVIMFWGFFNFLFGFGISFYALGLIENIKSYESFKVNKVLLLGLLLFLIILCHPLPFLLVGLYFSFKFMTFWDFKKLKVSLSFFFKFTISFSPSTIFFLNFIIKQKASSTYYEEGYTLLNRLMLFSKIESLSFIGYAEGNYLRVMNLIILTLLIIVLHDFFTKKIQLKDRIQLKSKFFFFISLFLICLFVPYGSAGGNIIPLRFFLFSNVFTVVLVSFINLNSKSSSLILLFWLFSIPLLIMRITFISSCSNMFVKLNQFNYLIEPNSIICSQQVDNVEFLPPKYKSHSYINIFKYSDCFSALESNSITINNFFVMGTLTKDSYIALGWKNKSLIPDNIYKNNGWRVDINKYNSNSGNKVDYILSYGKKEVVDTLNFDNYNQVAFDSLYSVKLFKLKMINTISATSSAIKQETNN